MTLAAEPIAADRAELAELAATFDDAWLAAARRAAGERIATSVFTFCGLFALGWGAPPLALFVVAGFAIGLAGDIALWLGARGPIEVGLARSRASESTLSRLCPARTGVDDTAASRPLSPAGELLVATWLVASLLGWQLFTRWRLARAVGDGTAVLHPGTDCFTPILDAVLYFTTLFLWLSGMTIADHVAGGLFGYDVRRHALTAFVTIGHALLLWRGVAEWRAAGACRADVAALAGGLSGH
jgi:hypothetical protein